MYCLVLLGVRKDDGFVLCHAQNIQVWITKKCTVTHYIAILFQEHSRWYYLFGFAYIIDCIFVINCFLFCLYKFPCKKTSLCLMFYLLVIASYYSCLFIFFVYSSSSFNITTTKIKGSIVFVSEWISLEISPINYLKFFYFFILSFQVLDDESEVFVVKMWRLLIYETEAKKLGLVKWGGLIFTWWCKNYRRFLTLTGIREEQN